MLHDISAADGVFTNYTPTLTATTTNPTMGSGATLEGRYCRIGDLVFLWVKILFGSSGAAAGSGSYRVSLPLPAANTTAGYNARIGQAEYVDASGNVRRNGMFIAESTDPDAAILLHSEGQTTGFVGAATPWTWANDDNILLWGFYEVDV